MKTLSRQRRWQLKKEAEGLCIICGGEPEREGSTTCDYHTVQKRLRARERRGCLGWEASGRGRPAVCPDSAGMLAEAREVA